MNCKHFLLIITIISFYNCKRAPFELTKIEGRQIEISDTLLADVAIENYIKPFRQNVNSVMDSVLAYSAETYTKKDARYNTALGNLMADVVFMQANPIFKKRNGHNIDAVLLNQGGIRSILSKGNITTRTAYEIMPFENSIVVVEMKGNKVLDMINYLKDAKVAHPIYGMKLTLDKSDHLKTAFVGNAPIVKDKTYFVATNDYLYNGGDNMTFFKPNEGVHVLNYKIRNALLDFFKKADTINPKRDDRFTKIN